MVGAADTGRARVAAAAAASATHRAARGLPATWEIITAMAWAPDAGTPLRDGDVDVAAIPLSRFPIRRRR